MEQRRLTTKIREQADQIHEVTLDEARALPNMLGVLCSAALRHHGWYGCTQSGEQHLYVLKEA